MYQGGYLQGLLLGSFFLKVAVLTLGPTIYTVTAGAIDDDDPGCGCVSLPRCDSVRPTHVIARSQWSCSVS